MNGRFFIPALASVLLLSGVASAQTVRPQGETPAAPAPKPDPSSPASTPLPARTWTGKTLKVPEQFATIGAALKAAEAGDTVLLAARKYTESVVLTRGVRLKGENAARCVLDGDTQSDFVVLVKDAPGFAIEDLTVGGGARKLSTGEPRGVVIDESKGTLDRVLFLSPGACGALVAGAASDAAFTECRWTGCTSGLAVTSGGKAAAAKCEFLGVSGTAAYARGAGSTLAFKGGSIEGSPLGIGAREQASAAIDSVTISGATDSALLAVDADLTASACTFRNGSGLRVTGKAMGTADKCTSQNGERFGFSAHGIGAKLVSKGNKVLHPTGAAFTISDGATGELDHDRVEGAGAVGVSASGAGSFARVQDSVFLDCGHSGISVHDGAGGDLLRNTCERCQEVGISIENHPESGKPVKVIGNTCRRNGRDGIVLFAGAQGQVEKNTCTDNGEDGISVLGQGTQVTLKENTCNSNKVSGIDIFHGAACVAESNTCTKNTGGGISVGEEKTVGTLKKNICRDNGAQGIGFFEGATGVADGNACEANAWSGVLVTDKGTNPAVRNNRCIKNKRWGIEVFDGAKPKLEGGNTLTGNEKGTIAQEK